MQCDYTAVLSTANTRGFKDQHPDLQAPMSQTSTHNTALAMPQSASSDPRYSTPWVQPPVFGQATNNNHASSPRPSRHPASATPSLPATNVNGDANLGDKPPSQPQHASSRPSSPLLPSPNSSIPRKPVPTNTPTPVGRSHRRDLSLPLAVAATTAIFGVTAWYARATFFNSGSSRTRDFFRDVFHIDIADTLTVLAVLSGVLAFLLGFVADHLLDVIQWALICRPDGVEALSILAISGTTGVLGTLGLLVDKITPSGARLWATGKILLRISIWISGIALFINTSIQTVYTPDFSYAATSGVGPFDGNLLQPYLDDLNLRNANVTDTTIPYSITALAHNIIVNPQHSFSSPHDSCQVGSGCDRYILPGGLGNAHLATDNGLPPTDHPDLPVMTFDKVPATRIDFNRSIAEGDTVFSSEDCDLFEQDPYMIALRFCMAPSHVESGSVIVAIYVCDLGTNHETGECLSNHTLYGDRPPTINTTFSLARLSTDLVVSRSNYSILRVTPAQNTKPIPDHSLISPNNFIAYRQALNWMLNNTAAGIPAPSSIVEYFWSSALQITGSEYWSPGPRVAFESFLVYPLWFWQVNNLGNNALRLVAATEEKLSFQTWREAVGEEFVTTAGLAGPAVRIAVDKAMFGVFVALVSLVLLVGWGIVIWLWCWKSQDAGDSRPKQGVRLPKISSYPIVDFALRTKTPHSSGNGKGFSLDFDLPNVVGAGDKAVRQALTGKKIVFAGTMDETEPFRFVLGR
jgi:hypothetical protein